MIGNALALLTSPRAKKDKKTSKNSLVAPMSTSQAQKKDRLHSFAHLLTESKESKKTKKSTKLSLSPAKVSITKQKEVQNTQTSIVALPLTHQVESLMPQHQKNIKKAPKSMRQARVEVSKQSTQEQLLLQKQHKNTQITKKQIQTPLNEALKQTKNSKPQSRTLADVAKIAQDHQLNLSKLELKTQSSKNEATPMLSQKPRRERLQTLSQALTNHPIKPNEVKVEKKTASLSIQKKEESKQTRAQSIRPQSPQSQSLETQVKNQDQVIAQTSLQPQENKEHKAPTLGELLKLAPKQQNALALEGKEEGGIEEKPKESKTQDVLMGELKRDVQVKIASSKETFTQFSQRIREEILNYKPPFSKLTMELNPVELGKLEITISKKGKELVVNVNANNPHALQAFVQNQSEFRATLSQVGFSNVELNFSQGESKGGGERNQEQEQQKRNKNSLEESITEIPALASMEIKMVQYA